MNQRKGSSDDHKKKGDKVENENSKTVTSPNGMNKKNSSIKESPSDVREKKIRRNTDDNHDDHKAIITEKNTTEKSTTEKSTTDKIATDKISTEKSATEKSTTDKSTPSKYVMYIFTIRVLPFIHFSV